MSTHLALLNELQKLTFLRKLIDNKTAITFFNNILQIFYKDKVKIKKKAANKNKSKYASQLK